VRIKNQDAEEHGYMQEMRRTREGIGGMNMDKEKKIAEIRKSAEEARKTKGTWVDGQDYADDVEFLLNELKRLEREYAEERAAHNAHVAELCELEKENQKLRQEKDKKMQLTVELLTAQREIERLRQLYEREREIADQALEQVKNLREERNQDRQWIEKASENVTQLQQERDMLIEGLRMCLFNHGCWREEDYVAYMRNILKEVGVTVE
jgi:DNA repair exonuclease SbcCD ATPase subunit